ncbi:MAG: rhodanese-like domain-containing protein [Bryobacteraceae bacterium]
MTRRIWLSVLSVFGLAGQEKELSADELKDMLDKKVKLFYLDVREPKELEELGTIDGHVNIPLSKLEARIAEIPRDVLIVAG